MSALDEYLEETRRAYDTYADAFDARFKKPLHPRLEAFMDRFLNELPGPKIVDFGCGSGVHARYFKNRGFRLLGIDISPEMVSRAQARGIDARVGDFSTYPIPDSHFDGVWACSSLVHLPKSRIPPTIERIAAILRPRGVLGIEVHEGTDEGLREHPDYPDVRRYHAGFTQEELRELFEPRFTPLHFERVAEKDHVFLHGLCRVRK